jgi:hypothetical protein
MMPTRPRRGDPPVFHLVLIKPTHYDDDGYPIRWVKAAIPSNTPACLNGLAEDAARRQVLGPGVGIRFHTFDETNQRVRPARIIRAIRKARGRALIGLVGVQSNQFPRAVDLARPFRAAGLPVCIGGFHVSGTIAMLPPDDTRDGRGASARHFVLRRRGRGRAPRPRHARRERRYGLPRENLLVLYPQYLREIAVKARGYWSVYRRSRLALEAVLAAPDRTTYTDVPTAPPEADEFDNLDLYHATSGGEAALARMRRDDALREKTH